MQTPSTCNAQPGHEPPDVPRLSFVVPFYDEEACVGSLVAEITRVMDTLALPCELVAVDDGSSDGTASVLAAATTDPRIRVLRHPENRGQAAALFWGMREARGGLVVTLDGDGQNDPADVPRLLAALEGWDMVVGVRTHRHDSVVRRAMSRLANAVRGRLLRDRMHDSGCALKVFRRELVDSFPPIRTLYSFLPAFAVAAGYRVKELPVRHRPRRGGRSSYGLWVFLWRPLLDLLGVWWFSRRRFPPPPVGNGSPAPTAAVSSTAAARWADPFQA